VARVQSEGLSFLTITLPTFGKDLEKGLSQGYVGLDQFSGFRRRGGTPVFLGGFLDLVFERSTGVILDEPDLWAIKALRQLTLSCAKIALECSKERTDAAFQRYIECEQEVKESDTHFEGALKSNFQRMGSLLYGDLFDKINFLVDQEELLPKHGPGATVDKLRGNAKFNQREWPVRLEKYFPSGKYLFHTYSAYMAESITIHFLEPGAERPVKVTAVPKTLKTPRLIAVEPTAMQYAQQSLLEVLVEGIEGSDSLSPFIGFTSQSENRQMAQIGSRDGTLATLDLSEASDRVSNQHVRALTRGYPSLAGAVDACRSRKADVDGYGVIRLAKFASMGSALCFPFEAMTFLVAVLLGIESQSHPVGRHNFPRFLKGLVGRVRIYGDDIIVPVEYAEAVIDSLESYGLKVNRNKSFWNGKFRESCGKEYYDGVDVSLTRVRQMLPTSRQDIVEIISTVSLRNQLFMAGFVQTVDWLDSLIEGLIPFPVVEPGSSILGRYSYEPYKAERMHATLHVPLVRGCVVSSKLPRNSLDGLGALMKYFLKRGDLPFADREHLLYSGRPVSVDIKTRWKTPF